MKQPSDYSQLLQLAQSGAGQQLFSLLRKNGGRDLDRALSLAASGDYSGAKQVLSSLLSDPQAQQLLKSLEESL